ncbi:hypothetical protein FT452_04520 [Campylobacter jejuni]|nr:hypothetical protein [Campylobacter jejuni]
MAPDVPSIVPLFLKLSIVVLDIFIPTLPERIPELSKFVIVEPERLTPELANIAPLGPPGSFLPSPFKVPLLINVWIVESPTYIACVFQLFGS